MLDDLLPMQTHSQVSAFERHDVSLEKPDWASAHVYVPAKAGFILWAASTNTFGRWHVLLFRFLHLKRNLRDRDPWLPSRCFGSMAAACHVCVCSCYLQHGEPGSCSALPSFFCLLTLQLQDDSDITFLKQKTEKLPSLRTSQSSLLAETELGLLCFLFFSEFLFFLKILWISLLHISWWPYQHPQKKKKSPGIKRILMPPVLGKPFWKPSIHMQNTLQLWATEENAPRLPGVSKQPNTWKHQGQTSKRILDDTIAPG